MSSFSSGRSSHLPSQLRDLRDLLATPTAGASAKGIAACTNSFLGVKVTSEENHSLISHAVRLHSNRSSGNFSGLVNVFDSLSSDNIRNRSISPSNSSTSSSSLLTDSDDDNDNLRSRENEKKTSDQNNQYDPELRLQSEECVRNNTLSSLREEKPSQFKSKLNLKVTLVEENTWAHASSPQNLYQTRHQSAASRQPPASLLLRSASGDSGASEDGGSRRQSVRKTPKGTLYMKGFPEGIGQFGIKSRGSAPVHSHTDYNTTSPSDVLTEASVHSMARILPMKDRLVVLGRLGRGASSIVYKALDLNRMILVALKTVPIFERDKRHQMIRELNTLYKLLHLRQRTLWNGKNSGADVDEGYEKDKDAVSTLRRGSERLCFASDDIEKGSTSYEDSLSENEVHSGGEEGGGSVNKSRQSSSDQSHAHFPFENSGANIVDFYDAYSDLSDGGVALMMEYMDGGSLQDLVDSGGCASEGVLANIAAQALAGLGFLHNCNQIHRDIKPANLLINLNGQVKVSDLGILREVDPTVDSNHLVQTYIGTTTYMSPERLDAKEYSYSSDIWSLGITLLTVSLGRLPSQLSGRYWTILSNIRDKPSPSLADDDNPDHSWSDEFQDFIAQCLKKNPTERPTATELLGHPFVRKAYSHSSNQTEIEQLGLTELDSILHSLFLHLEGRQRLNYEVFIILDNNKQKAEIHSAGHINLPPVECSDSKIVLDCFVLTLCEVMKLILFNEYPLRVKQRFDALQLEMTSALEIRESILSIFNIFFPRSVSSENSTDTNALRLAALAAQLHIPLALATKKANEFISSRAEPLGGNIQTNQYI